MSGIFSPRYDLFVFDWDGTVMDTTAAIAEGIRHAAAEMGCRVPSTALARSVIGLDWHSALLKCVPELPESEHRRFNELYRAWYIPHERDVTLFAGMRELITGLKAHGLATAVATGKSREGLKRVFAATGLGPYFDTTETASECASKPDPEMLEMIGIETGIPPERTVMIGDTVHDVTMAKRYGCDAAAMTYGASTLGDLVASAPQALCADTAELASWLGVAPLLTEKR
jgi:phosphoglycolate phosphatase